MSRKEFKEESGSPNFVPGNVVGCFSHKDLLFANHLSRCGPSAPAPLPGPPWSPVERFFVPVVFKRRVEKQPARGDNGLTIKVKSLAQLIQFDWQHGEEGRKK